MWKYIIIAIAAAIAAPILVLRFFRKKTGGGNLTEQGARPRSDEGPANNARKENAEIEHSKLVLHALLQDVRGKVEDMLGETSNYSNSLQNHREDLRKVRALTDIKALEEAIFDELEKMIQTSSNYRAQLDDANKLIEQQQDQLEQLEADSQLDFLTKVPNRRAFDKRIKEEFARFKRYNNTFSLFVIDVDHFKKVNDQHGHLAGDKILRAIAGILNEQRRSSDVLARYGGEEFVMLLPETPSERAVTLAEKTCRKIETARFRYEDTVIEATVSVGVGEVSAFDENEDGIFSRVDTALYEAKSKGRNRAQVASSPARES